MVSNHQVRKLKKMLSNGNTLRESSVKAGMDEKTMASNRRSSERSDVYPGAPSRASGTIRLYPHERPGDNDR
jgi:hypothetical protein